MNKEIKKCPMCGETKTTLQYIKEGIVDKGISASGVIQTVKTFTNCYAEKLCKCYSCGYEWSEKI